MVDACFVCLASSKYEATYRRCFLSSVVFGGWSVNLLLVSRGCVRACVCVFVLPSICPYLVFLEHVCLIVVRIVCPLFFSLFFFPTNCLISVTAQW